MAWMPLLSVACNWPIRASCLNGDKVIGKQVWPPIDKLWAPVNCFIQCLSKKEPAGSSDLELLILKLMDIKG